MGYLTSYSGEITITPPIPHARVKGSPFLVSDDDDGFGDHAVKFSIDVDIRDTDEGTLTVRRAVALVPIMEDRYKGYDILEDVQKAIDAYPEHEFTGRLDCEGTDSLDVWRLEVHDRTAVKVVPRIVWPLPGGGEEVEPPR
jgi:hypothetical protein